MKRLFLILAALGFAATAQAQIEPNLPNIELSLSDDGEITAHRTGYGTFTVEVKATTPNGEYRQLCYVTESVQTLELDGDFEITELHWNWLQGKLDSDVDTMFVYRLPYRGCRKAEAHALSSSDLGIYRGNFSNFRVWQFDVKKGAKIYPIREGQIIRINESSEITIQHSDGSLADYSILGSALVKEGQKVTNKTQLGKAGEINGKSMIRVAVYYYISNKNKILFPNMFSQKIYIDPYFKKGRKLEDGKKY